MLKHFAFSTFAEGQNKKRPCFDCVHVHSRGKTISFFVCLKSVAPGFVDTKINIFAKSSPIEITEMLIRKVRFTTATIYALCLKYVVFSNGRQYALNRGELETLLGGGTPLGIFFRKGVKLFSIIMKGLARTEYVWIP